MQKAVIFDLDGVIFNTENCWKNGFEIITKRWLDAYDQIKIQKHE